jgi:hypothetical protein
VVGTEGLQLTAKYPQAGFSAKADRWCFVDRKLVIPPKGGQVEKQFSPDFGVSSVERWRIHRLNPALHTGKLE